MHWQGLVDNTLKESVYNLKVLTCYTMPRPEGFNLCNPAGGNIHTPSSLIALSNGCYAVYNAMSGLRLQCSLQHGLVVC